MNEELKPCPFCGGKAEITVIAKRYKSIIDCTTPQCGLTRHSYNNGDTDENAARRLAAAWNRRHLYPCDVCKYNPPSSGDGKPCLMCPACASEGGDDD